MAEIDLTEPVTIRSSRGEVLEVPRGALPGFLNDDRGFVVLDSAGRKASHQPTTTAKDA